MTTLDQAAETVLGSLIRDLALEAKAVLADPDAGSSPHASDAVQILSELLRAYERGVRLLDDGEADDPFTNLLWLERDAYFAAKHALAYLRLRYGAKEPAL